FTERSPADYWSPHWQISMQPNTEQHWDIYEAHTARRLHGIGSNTIFDQISILLALTGLLREGINLAPIDSGLVRVLIPSHPIWVSAGASSLLLGQHIRLKIFVPWRLVSWKHYRLLAVSACSGHASRWI